MLRVSRRALAVWVALFALYAATVGMRAFDHSAYAGDEPRFLLTTRSLADDGDVNVFDDYRSNAYRSFYKHPLTSGGAPDRAARTQYEPGGTWSVRRPSGSVLPRAAGGPPPRPAGTTQTSRPDAAARVPAIGRSPRPRKMNCAWTFSVPI